MHETTCPGCGLTMPAGAPATDVYYNTSPECWNVYTEVLATEYSSPAIFQRVHQLTVDTYAVQHAGGPHPDKSVAVHLCGLHFVLDLNVHSPDVPRLLQRLATVTRAWPHFSPPEMRKCATVFNVALAQEADQHIATVQRWAGCVWSEWSEHHAAVANLASTIRSGA